MSLLEDALGSKLDCRGCNQPFGSPFGAEPMEYGAAAPASVTPSDAEAMAGIGILAAETGVILGASLGTGLSAAAIYALGGKWTLLLAPVLGVFLAVPLVLGAGALAARTTLPSTLLKKA